MFMLCMFLVSSYRNSNKEADQADTPLIGDEKLPIRGLIWGLFAIPALCDLTATTLLNVGLILVSASIFQMMRGAIIIFTALYSYAFLGRRYTRKRIFGLAVVVLGVAIVGASPVVSGGSKTQSSTLGILVIVGSQLISAAQFALEESLMTKYTCAPVQLVGIEGISGTIYVSLGMLIMNYALGTGYWKVSQGWGQITGHETIWIASVGIIFSIAVFNFTGLSITRYFSATARTTVDTCRTMIIWIFSLALKWEHFLALEVLGFVLLIYGTCVFNQITQFAPGFGEHEERLIESTKE